MRSSQPAAQLMSHARLPSTLRWAAFVLADLPKNRNHGRGLAMTLTGLPSILRRRKAMDRSLGDKLRVLDLRRFAKPQSTQRWFTTSLQWVATQHATPAFFTRRDAAACAGPEPQGTEPTSVTSGFPLTSFAGSGDRDSRSSHDRIWRSDQK
jgi:hypothetical protein